jgi:hypothetical protein
MIIIIIIIINKSEKKTVWANEKMSGILLPVSFFGVFYFISFFLATTKGRASTHIHVILLCVRIGR